ncbi:MAG: hypothetical protein JKY11_04950, partial [Alphaproteobacteria bacterium]|nr:hypothetical protein [Alphaproteobacteria bacterium]
DIASSSGNESIKDKVQERFKDTTGAFKEKWDHFRGNTTDSPQEPSNPDANKPRSTMSSGFNKSSFEGRSQSDMNDAPKAQGEKPKPS